MTLQEMLARMTQFWAEKGCAIHNGYDLEMGAGTFNPVTFFRCLGPEPYRAVYIEPSRRPKDGRYAQNPNRMQHFMQYQVILKPSPPNIQDLLLQSLEAVGFNINEHDIRFVHDDWEQPSLGAWGLGWEVWCDGMEVCQFTYFQSVGGVELNPITVELTGGCERLAMYLQKKDNVWDVQWNETLTYGDIYRQNEIEFSTYNFEVADVDMWWRHFEGYEAEAKRVLAKNLPLPAYDFLIKASHAFNLLDARGVISVTERTGYITRLRDLARLTAESYLKEREKLGYPLLNKQWPSIVSQEQPSVHHLPTSFDPAIKEDFVLEIGSEELPASFVPIGCANLQKDFTRLLNELKIPFDSLETHGTPRRLTAYVKGLAQGRAAESTERRGPPVSAAYDEKGVLTKTGEGFFRSLNLPASSLEEVQSGKAHGISIRDQKGTNYLFALLTSASESTSSLLAEHLPQLILNLDFPKKMRWGDLDIAFPRPLRWILALHGKTIVPFSIANIASDRKSSGHPQLCPGAFVVGEAGEYFAALKKHQILVQIEERKAEITKQLKNIEKQTQSTVIAAEKVLPQVLHLVEWPLLATAHFDSAFLRVPEEVLISEMVEHQKYFPLASQDNGRLVNMFVITANNTPSDEIRHGNVKVLSARLADGVFLYEQDLKTSLDAYNEKLKQITFRKGLGSVYDKVLRIVANVEILHRYLPIADLAKAKRAAMLCKADLASQLVNEFPELQGTIGKIYASVHGEDPEVALAIDEHWMPRGEQAPLPSSPIGLLVSLADKFDNFFSCFALGLKPTSSSDPYALRRQALGIIKMLIQGRHFLPLTEVLSSSYKEFLIVTELKKDPALLQEMQEFLTHRIKTVFLDYQLEKDEIEAALSATVTDIYDSYCRVEALHTFRISNPRFPLLAEVYKRAKGQVDLEHAYPFSQTLLVEPAEKALAKALDQIEPQFNAALEKHDYRATYTLLAELQPALATLFDNVKILADDTELRQNRLALLSRVFKLFAKLLDFSKLRLG